MHRTAANSRRGGEIPHSARSTDHQPSKTVRDGPLALLTKNLFDRFVLSARQISIRDTTRWCAREIPTRFSASAAATLTAARGRAFIDADEGEQLVEAEAELVGFQAAAVLEAEKRVGISRTSPFATLFRDFNTL